MVTPVAEDKKGVNEYFGALEASMSDTVAVCGCCILQDGSVNDKPTYRIGFCDIHNLDKICERQEAAAEATARKLVQHIATNMERESALLYPTPATILMDPYGLLDIIREEGGFEPEVIDGWMVEAQKSTKE